jgi:hypothetical protein
MKPALGAASLALALALAFVLSGCKPSDLDPGYDSCSPPSFTYVPYPVRDVGTGSVSCADYQARMQDILIDSMRSYLSAASVSCDGGVAVSGLAQPGPGWAKPPAPVELDDRLLALVSKVPELVSAEALDVEGEVFVFAVGTAGWPTPWTRVEARSLGDGSLLGEYDGPGDFAKVVCGESSVTILASSQAWFPESVSLYASDGDWAGLESANEDAIRAANFLPSGCTIAVPTPAPTTTDVTTIFTVNLPDGSTASELVATPLGAAFGGE